MWDERGRKVSVFQFIEGILKQYSITDHSPDAKAMVCKYEHERLSSGSPKECSAYEDVKNGLLNVAPEDEPLVPKERDARRNSPDSK
jgi:hypothetical protein